MRDLVMENGSRVISRALFWGLSVGLALTIVYLLISMSLTPSNDSDQSTITVQPHRDDSPMSLDDEEQSVDAAVTSNQSAASTVSFSSQDIEAAQAIAERAVQLYSSVGSHDEASLALDEFRSFASSELVERLDVLWASLPEVELSTTLNLVKFNQLISPSESVLRFEIVTNKEVDFGVDTQMYNQTIFVTLESNKFDDSWTVIDLHEIGLVF